MLCSIAAVAAAALGRAPDADWSRKRLIFLAFGRHADPNPRLGRLNGIDIQLGT
jgi:hypothetical protein